LKLAKYFIIFFILITSAISQDLNFTNDEINWIKKNPVIELGADYKWPPFDFADNHGNHTGLSSEYLKLLSKKSGLKFRVTTGIWAEIIKGMKLKKFDGLTCAVKTDERLKYLNFTDPYLSIPMVIITTIDNNTIKNISDLKTKLVSVNRGSYIHEWLKTHYPEIKLLLTTSNEASLEAVSLGNADAYVGNQAVATFIINQYLLNNLKTVTKLKDFSTSVSVAIDKENKILFNIIQKTLNNITQNEHQNIKSKWKKVLDSNYNTKSLRLSKEQITWINSHPTIQYTGDPNWLPFEAVNKKNKHIGIAAEYVREIQKRTGIKFEYIPSLTWLDAVKKIKNNNIPMIVETTNSKLALIYTKPFISNSIVIIMNKNTRYVEDLNSISHKKIAIIKEYGYVEELKKEYRNIEFYEVNNIQDGLSDVSTGRYDALLCTFALGSYTISEMGLNNVEIVGKTKVSTAVGFGVINEYKPLVQIINIALASIDEEQKHNILKRWTYQKYVEKIDYTLAWQLAVLFILFIIGSLYWNRKLSIEITKRKVAQEELFKLNQKLEEATEIAQSANRAKSDFLSNMSHEIRTPMNAILGFAELLDENIEDKKLKSFIKTIRSSGKALLLLINDILDLSKIESGKLELIKKKVNIKKLFDETLNIFKLLAEQKGLQLILDIDKNMPSAILIDQTRLNQILINLIGNAIKFTEKGSINVSVIVNQVYEHTSKIDLTITVKDSGIGISQKDINRIFNTFEQAENQNIKKYGGTGLGLTISKKLTHLMNGSLEIDSQLGEGSSFEIKLKNIDIASLSYEDMQDQSSLDYSSIEFDNAIILVVDDIKENRDLIKESFNNTNIEVIEADNGKKAINSVKKQKIDLILMDIRMPIMDGYTATRHIKEFNNTPIIALTASIMQNELKELNSGLFDGYLRKPVSKSELFEEISKFLSFKNSTKVVEAKEKIVIANIDNLKNFLKDIDIEIKHMYFEAIKTNDINLITNFSNLLLEVSSKYNIQYMINYSNTLLDKIDSFEIDSINVLLNTYEKKIKNLTSKLNSV